MDTEYFVRSASLCPMPEIVITKSFFSLLRAEVGATVAWVVSAVAYTFTTSVEATPPTVTTIGLFPVVASSGVSHDIYVSEMSV